MKRHSRNLGCFCLFVLPLVAMAAAEEAPQKVGPYQKAEAALSRIFSERYSAKDIREVAAGDLNDDGKEDLSVLLQGQDGPQLAVLFAISPDGFKLGAITKSFCEARYHYNLEVRGQSLFVTTVHSLAPDSHTYQFDMRGNQLVLIGLEETNLENEQADGYGKSVNYLTHKVIYWRHTGHKRREVKRILPKSPLASLDGFDCYAFEEPHGWIRENFEFEP